MTAAHYRIVYVRPTMCIDCKLRRGAFRVVDTRKKFGERYPGPRRCKPCASRYAAWRNEPQGKQVAGYTSAETEGT